MLKVGEMKAALKSFPECFCFEEKLTHCSQTAFWEIYEAQKVKIIRFFTGENFEEEFAENGK